MIGRHELRVIPGGKTETVELRALGREVVTFRYLASRAPVDVAVAAKTSPRVLRVDARHRTTQAIETGPRMTWSWRGGVLRVSSLDVSDTASEYEVTLELEA